MDRVTSPNQIVLHLRAVDALLSQTPVSREQELTASDLFNYSACGDTWASAKPRRGFAARSVN